MGPFLVAHPLPTGTSPCARGASLWVIVHPICQVLVAQPPHARLARSLRGQLSAFWPLSAVALATFPVFCRMSGVTHDACGQDPGAAARAAVLAGAVLLEPERLPAADARQRQVPAQRQPDACRAVGPPEPV